MPHLWQESTARGTLAQENNSRLRSTVSQGCTSWLAESNIFIICWQIFFVVSFFTREIRSGKYKAGEEEMKKKMAVVGAHRDGFSGYLEAPPPRYLRARQRSLGHWFPTRQLANPYLKHCPPCWHNRTMAPPHPANQTIRTSRSPLKVSGVVNKLCNLGFTCCLSPSPLTGTQV